MADLGYEGEATIVVAFKKPRSKRFSGIQQQFNRAHNRLRTVGECGNILLKAAFRALRNISLCPWKIGDIVAAALVILHIDRERTT
ncbi:transposase family protein [Micromonospora echinospora]|uniref:transposase family protein n=1 Tax=Micromonospora echinospora TaxID=1877 RepID=UPI003F4D1343